MISKEQLVTKLFVTALALTGLGVGMNELDKLADSKHFQEITKQTVEILKQPEKALQTQAQSQQTIIIDKLISEPIRYELPKPVMLTDLCKYYPDMQKCLEKKGEENEKAEN